MNWNQIEGSWNEFRGKAKRQWGKLTNDDLDEIDGRRRELEGILQKQYGYGQEVAKEEVESWLRKM